jgi:hypothetical protein
VADELIPAQIRNGGAGSAPTAGRSDVSDYRSVQAPASTNQEGIDRAASEAGTAGVSRARALGQVFENFEGMSTNVANETAAKAGALAGAAAGATGRPDYKQGLARLTAYGKAFNNSATGAYAIQAEAQADDAAARLRVEANNDPNTFRTTFSAVRDAVLKNAPADAVPMLTELYNKHLANGIAAISGDQATEIRNLHRQEYDVGVQRQVSRVATLQGSADPHDQLAGMDEQVKLSLLINGGVNSGIYSPAEAEAMHIATARQVTEQVFDTQVDRELSRPDGDPETLIARFRAAHDANGANPNEPQVLSEPEFQKLMQNATTKVREQRLLDSMNKANGKTAEQIKFEAGDVEYTSRLLSNTLTLSALNQAVRSGDLKPERATGLRQLMEQGPTPKSQPLALAGLYHDPNFLNMKDEEIAAWPGVSNADKITASKERDRRNASWEGTQSVKDAKAVISLNLKIPAGTPSAALSDEQRKGLAAAEVEFTSLMNKVDPAHRDHEALNVAQQVVRHQQQREAAAEVQSLTSLRDSALKLHGPGTPEAWDDAKLQAYLKQKADAIAAASARAKGE